MAPPSPAMTQEQFERAIERFRMLREIDRSILSADSLPDLARRTVPWLLEVTGADRIAFALYNIVAGTAELVAALSRGGDMESPRPAVRIETLLSPGTLACREIQVLPDLAAAADRFPDAPALVAQGYTCGAWIPLVLDDQQLVGGLMLKGRSAACLSPESLEIAGAVADLLAIATARASTRERLERDLERRRLLGRIDRAILGSEDLTGLAADVMADICRLVHADRLALIDYGPGSGGGRLIAIQRPHGESPVPYDPERLAEILLPPMAADRREVHRYPDLAAVTDAVPWAETMVQAGLSIGAFVPLATDVQVIGGLALAGSDPSMLWPETIEIARELGDHLAVALASAAGRAELADREARLRAILEGSPNGVLTVDRSNRVGYANPAAHTLFLAEPGGLVGREVDELVPQHAPPSDWFDAGQPLPVRHAVGSQARRLDGTLFPVHVLVSPVDTTGGSMAIATLVDLSERAELEERLHQAERLEVLGQFAGILAHDVRNHLTTVRWSAELLADALGPGHPDIGDVSLIQQAAADGLAVTKSVLEFARPVSEVVGATSMEQHLADGAAMLRGVVGTAVNVRIDMEPGLPAACISSAALTQILVNMATNARDAMPDGGDLLISVTAAPSGSGPDTADGRAAPFIRVTVADTGIGMDEATRRRAFEAFFTTKTDASTAAGTGLGLSSVFLIVQRAGGTINLESVRGTGTTFTIDLPAIEA